MHSPLGIRIRSFFLSFLFVRNIYLFPPSFLIHIFLSIFFLSFILFLFFFLPNSHSFFSLSVVSLLFKSLTDLGQGPSAESRMPNGLFMVWPNLKYYEVATIYLNLLNLPKGVPFPRLRRDPLL